MNIIEYAEKVSKVKLTYCQMDLLEILEKDPDAWQPRIKPKTQEMKTVLSVYKQWKEHKKSLVAC